MKKIIYLILAAFTIMCGIYDGINPGIPFDSVLVSSLLYVAGIYLVVFGAVLAFDTTVYSDSDNTLLDELIGKKFKKVTLVADEIVLSEWTDVVTSVFKTYNHTFDPGNHKNEYYEILIHVRGQKNGFTYMLDEVIFIQD